MSQMSSLRNVLLAGAALTVVAACSGSEISSPGEGNFVGAPGGSTGGGTGGGATGTTDLTFGGCPGGTTADTIPGSTTTACRVLTDGAGNILSPLTLTASANERRTYYFEQPTFVGTDVGPDGTAGGTQVVLTIQEGAQLAFANATDFLSVQRGSRIEAEGTASAPIVFTSDEDILDNGVADDSQGAERGQWGGLILNGRANINSCANPADPATCSSSGEGGTGNYGGNLNTDNSGTLEYVRVQYAGFEITTDNELNGIAFQGVGSGTTLNNIQVHNNDDDGVEFFGGTASISNVVITGVDDDGLDWVAGWQGAAQNVLIKGSGVGDNGFEGDNNENNNSITPQSNPTIANFTLIGGAGEDVGMQIREGTFGTFINGVVSAWEDGCLDLDDDVTVDAAGTDLTIDTTFFSCTVGLDDVKAGDSTTTLAQVGTITEGTSTLNGVLPGANEQIAATDATTLTPVAGFTFEANQYAGAFDPAHAPEETWAFGWTVPGSVFDSGCPTHPNVSDITSTSTVSHPGGGNVCEVNGTIASDLFMTPNNLWVLRGAVRVGADQGPDATSPDPDSPSAVLTILPGTTVVGQSPTDFLVVNRGSQIEAAGTADEPIIFTSDEDILGQNTGADLFARGQWGGLIINGNAPINSCANPAVPASCESSGEGGTGNYGGNDANDDSGTLRYVRVQHAGFEITPDNELNGIAFQGVGDSTEVDFIQVHANDDDGVEFFGGTVDVKHVLLTGVDDDALDWVAGWNGSAQYVLVVGSGAGDNGFEGDNNENNNSITPQSNPTISNFTLIGGPSEDVGMQIREGTTGTFINGVVSGWEDGCLDLDDTVTLTAAASGGSMLIDNTVFKCTTGLADVKGGDPITSLADINGTITENTVALGVAPGATNAFVLTGTDASIAPTFPGGVDTEIDQTPSQIGALASPSDLWFQGWTVSGSF